MPFYVRNGSVWTPATDLKIYSGSSWANVQNAYIRSGSSWVEFFSRATITLNATYSVSITSSGSFAAYAKFTLESDGDIFETTGDDVGDYPSDVGDWVDPKSAAPGSFQVRGYNQSGSGGVFTGDTTNTWLDLSSNREWTVSVSSLLQTGFYTFDIDIGVGGTVLDTATITLSADVS